MKIGFIIPVTKVFGSVRLMLEISNVLNAYGNDCYIFSDDGKYDGWLPCTSKHLPLTEIKYHEFDCLILMCSLIEPYFTLWYNTRAKIKTWCVMGFEPSMVTETMFINPQVHKVISENWIIYDGLWQEEYIKKFNKDCGPAVGGINLKQFHPVNVKKQYDVVWSGDRRPRKGGDTVEKAIATFSNDSYFGKGIPQDKLAEFISGGVVFADGHLRGGFCNPIAEAMACGVPVVCTDTPCNSMFAIHNETAIKVSCNDVNAMRSAINDLLNDSKRRELLAKNALDKIRQLDYEIVIPKFDRAIRAHVDGGLKVSVIITAYDCKGMGRYLLNEALRSVSIQSYKNIEVVIGDNFRDRNAVSEVIKNYGNLDIKVIENKGDKDNSIENWNNCIKVAKGDVITLLCMDDYYKDNNSVKSIAAAFMRSDIKWSISNSMKVNNGVVGAVKNPVFSDMLYKGKNTLGCLSVPSFRNEYKKYLDNEMQFYTDIDLYLQLYTNYGLPRIINEVIICQRISPMQSSNDMNQYDTIKELEYLTKKYEKCKVSN